MEQVNFRKCIPLLAFLLPISLAAKCPPGTFVLSIKRSTGTIIPLLPGSTTTDIMFGGDHDHYGTLHLGVGDTLLVQMTTGVCLSYGALTKDGAPYPTTGTLAKCTAAGVYEGSNCDDGCNKAFYTIAPLGGGVGPVSMHAVVALEGAVVSTASISMRVDLKNQGLLPAAEPYSAMGYVHSGGGGGETLGAGAAAQGLVDWILVELRSASQPSVVVVSEAALLMSNGSIVNADDFTPLRMNAAPGPYYVAIKHRSHLGIMSAEPIPLHNGSTALLNFVGTTGIPTYGTDAQHLVGNKRFMWPGNSKWTSGTQSIKYAGANNDRDAVLNRVGGSVPTGTANGYFSEDVNLDGAVKYAGANNDRDVILLTIGGSVPTATRTEQVPN